MLRYPVGHEHIIYHLATTLIFNVLRIFRDAKVCDVFHMTYGLKLSEFEEKT